MFFSVVNLNPLIKSIKWNRLSGIWSEIKRDGRGDWSGVYQEEDFVDHYMEYLMLNYKPWDGKERKDFIGYPLIFGYHIRTKIVSCFGIEDSKVQKFKGKGDLKDAYEFAALVKKPLKIKTQEFKKDDQICEVDGKQFTSDKEFLEVLADCASNPQKSNGVSFKVIRDGQLMELTVEPKLYDE